MIKLTPKNLLLFFLFAAAVFVMGYRLWYPPVPYFDEVHYVKWARALIHNDEYLGYASQHPPLWHLLMALCIEIFGDHPFSWRITSLIAHIGVVIMTFLLTRRITKNETVAWLAVFLMFVDCLSLTQARIAMMNSTMLLFILLSIYFFLGAFERSSVDRDALRKAGIFWALALATKMVAINVLFFFAPLLILEIKKRPAQRAAILKDLGMYFLLAPVLITFCAFIFVPLLQGRSIADIWGIPAYNIHYHATTTQTHGYTSRWWSWPLLLRPISFYFKGGSWNDPVFATSETILAIGNPILFWAIPLAMFHMLWEFLERRSRVYGIVLLGFLSQWLSFALGSRMQFFHYFYQAMPFVVMALGLFLARIYSLGRGGKVFVAVYLVAVAGMFLYWYPILTGMETSRAFFYQHMWFPKWI